MCFNEAWSVMSCGSNSVTGSLKKTLSTLLGWNWLKHVRRETKSISRGRRGSGGSPPSEDANVSPSSDGTCRALSRSLLLPTWSRLQITGMGCRLAGLRMAGMCCLHTTAGTLRAPASYRGTFRSEQRAACLRWTFGDGELTSMTGIFPEGWMRRTCW